jgi:hypothetical protein
MFLLNPSQILLPKRSNACADCNRAFDFNGEYISYLPEEGWIRKDYCLFCWEKIATAKSGVYWKAHMLQKSQKKIPIDEKAFLLFKELILDNGDAKKSFVLALYLERRKQMIRRAENKKTSKIYYEIPQTGEVVEIHSLLLSYKEGQTLLNELKETFRDHLEL